MKEFFATLGRIAARTPYLAVQFVLSFFLMLVFALFALGGVSRTFEVLVGLWEFPQGLAFALLVVGVALSLFLGFLLFKMMAFSVKSTMESARGLEEDVGAVFAMARRTPEEPSADELKGGISLDASVGRGGGLSMTVASAQELELVGEGVALDLGEEVEEGVQAVEVQEAR